MQDKWGTFMKWTRIAILLPVSQVVLAAVLLTVGSRQTPQTAQDYPPPVGSATKACQAINAPVALIEGAFVGLSQKAGAELGSRAWDLFFLVGVIFVWFLIGLEIEGLHKRGSHWRIPVDCLAIGIGVILILVSRVASQQGETALMMGSAAWGITLIGIYGWALVRLVGSKRMKLRS